MRFRSQLRMWLKRGSGHSPSVPVNPDAKLMSCGGVYLLIKFIGASKLDFTQIMNGVFFNSQLGICIHIKSAMNLALFKTILP